MKDMNEMVNQLVEDIDEIPEDCRGTYVVWAVGLDEDGNTTSAEMVLAVFECPDQAVHYAKNITLADIVNLAAADDCDCEVAANAHAISVEIETVVNDEDGCAMSIGTVYKKRIEIFEAIPDDFVVLLDGDFEIIEETGLLQIPCSILRDYNKNDVVSIIFGDEEEPSPIEYKIISKTTGGYYICDFV